MVVVPFEQFGASTTTLSQFTILPPPSFVGLVPNKIQYGPKISLQGEGWGMRVCSGGAHCAVLTVSVHTVALFVYSHADTNKTNHCNVGNIFRGGS